MVDSPGGSVRIDAYSLHIQGSSGARALNAEFDQWLARVYQNYDRWSVVAPFVCFALGLAVMLPAQGLDAAVKLSAFLTAWRFGVVLLAWMAPAWFCRNKHSVAIATRLTRCVYPWVFWA